ncbi:MFS transporter, DHA2 family, multidrug resistance protein [Amycolatopsis marina]|uniref:MFS transporter, DHA2 family, multidrug resistance protein n=1 Tax=Amycolatopsis marina TaxID=490629 RepID=A0A1I0ZN49_9PSEU|nr:MFS transporter [Amycolatopsis marina]SFB25818.1 MFS transporter, DHA2 family, multidrug resistance protein [Amycolatopsis marina]
MSSEAEPQLGASATGREWAGLAVLALPTFLLALDLSVLFLALPHLSADLGPSSTQWLWITDIYGFMVAGFLLTMGGLGDRIGRRKLLLIGATAFAVASVLAAYSDSAVMLIATRALLGVAGATLMPCALALIRTMFTDTAQRSMAIGMWMSSFLLGAALGPLIGGLLLEWFWWGSVFLLAVPVMALLLIVGPMVLPESRDADAPRIDLLSIVLSLAAILPVIYGSKELAVDGVGLPALIAIAIGLASGVVFVRRQNKLLHPLIDLRLFSSRTFSTALAGQVLIGVIFSGIALFLTQYLQVVKGLSPLQTGLWLLVPSLVMIVGSLASPVVAQKIRPGYVVGAGLIVTATGGVVLTAVGPESGLALIITGFTLAYFGGGPIAVLATDLIVNSAPPEKAGSASAISETGAELGFAMGVATLGSVGAAVYQSQMGDLGTAVPADAAAKAQESIGAAASAAGELPAASSQVLFDTAREAFSSAVSVIGGVSAVIAVGLAVVISLMLRHVRLGDGQEGGDAQAAKDSGSMDDLAEQPN